MEKETSPSTAVPSGATDCFPWNTHGCAPIHWLVNVLYIHVEWLNSNTPNTVQKGLVVPGQDGVKVVHGSYYGVGIYLSPDPSFSLGQVVCIN